MMAAVKAILFDFFGVFYTPIYTPIVKKYIPEEEWPAWFKKFELLDLDELSEEEFAAQLSERAQIPRSQLDREIAASPMPNEPLFAFVGDELRGKYKLGVLTNVQRTIFEKVAAGRLDSFDVVIVSSDIKIIKPDPRIFELAITKLGVPAEEILFVDDKAPNVEAAKQLGMHGLVYTDFESFKAALKTMLEPNATS
jgi:HAD superfamily hydrolase (TIGR01509 family)